MNKDNSSPSVSSDSNGAQGASGGPPNPYPTLFPGWGTNSQGADPHINTNFGPHTGPSRNASRGGGRARARARARVRGRDESRMVPQGEWNGQESAMLNNFDDGYTAGPHSLNWLQMLGAAKQAGKRQHRQRELPSSSNLFADAYTNDFGGFANALQEPRRRMRRRARRQAQARRNIPLDPQTALDEKGGAAAMLEDPIEPLEKQKNVMLPQRLLGVRADPSGRLEYGIEFVKDSFSLSLRVSGSVMRKMYPQFLLDYFERHVNFKEWPLRALDGAILLGSVANFQDPILIPADVLEPEAPPFSDSKGSNNGSLLPVAAILPVTESNLVLKTPHIADAPSGPIYDSSFPVWQS